MRHNCDDKTMLPYYERETNSNQLLKKLCDALVYLYICLIIAIKSPLKYFFIISIIAVDTFY